MPAFRLIPLTADPLLTQKEYAYEDGMTVGRLPGNSMVLASDSVSRNHARIRRRDGEFVVLDMGSSNGTFVNGERTRDRIVRDGDKVKFGNIEFRFETLLPATELITPGGAVGSPSGTTSARLRFEDEDSKSPKPHFTAVLRPDQVRAIIDRSTSELSVAKAADQKAMARLSQRFSVLYRLSEYLREAAELPEAELLGGGLKLVFETVPADRGAVLTRFSTEVEQFDVAAVHQRNAPRAGAAPDINVSRTILNRVVGERIAVLSSDAQGDERFAHAESIVMNSIRSTICAPLVAGEAVIGALHLDIQSPVVRFEGDDLEFVTMVAHSLAMAIENRRMRAAAIHRERLAAMGETVAGISHNVKNILLLMQGGADVMGKALDKNDLGQAKQSWGVVTRGIDKIGRLVREMLDYSSNKKPDLTSVDINDMIVLIAHEIEDQLVAKAIGLELELDDQVRPRMVDELGLQRTIMNLIVNAVEAIPAGNGIVNVSTTVRPSGSLVIAVRDNGMGIPPDKLEKIFLPFFTTKGSAGTGLGLPMCKKVVEDMNGTLDVHSEVGTGTTFTIVLPPEEGTLS